MKTSTSNASTMALIPLIFNYLKQRKLPKSLVGLLLFFAFLVPNLSSGQSIDQLYQWANKKFEWQFGNLGTSNSNYQEDDTVPYWVELSGLTVGQIYTIEIEWDTSQGGTHSLDYLTTYDRSYTPINPAVEAGLADTVADDTEDIPKDNIMQSAGTDWTGTQEDGVFTIWNGSFADANGDADGDATSGYTLDRASGANIVEPDPAVEADYNGNSSTFIQLTFKATATDVVIAWGGHIAAQKNWGFNNSAGTQSGSPFHMRINQWFIPTNTCPTSTITDFTQLNVGSLDRSLSAAAVVIPGTITVSKDAQPNDAEVFDFTASAASVSIRVFDGKLDLNNDGIIDSGDTGSFNGTAVINGSLDINGDDAITNADDASSFLGSGPSAIDVIDGGLDMNNDGFVTTLDDSSAEASVEFNFTLVDDGSSSNLSTILLYPANWTITELNEANWTLSAINTTGDSSAANTIPDGSDEGSVSLTVAEADVTSVTFVNTIDNILPLAVDDSNSTTEDVAVGGNVLGNDDQGDAPAVVTDFDPVSANGGAVVVAPNGDYTYTPPAGFVGTDTFTYTITDDNGDTSTATVTITVTDEGDPDAVDDSETTTEDTPVTGDWDDNDSLIDDAVLALQPGDATPSNGTVTVNADGSYVYTPNTGFVGTDSFTYTICDDDSPTPTCDTATVTITVTDEGDPDAVDDSETTTEDTPVTGDWDDNDSLIDDAVLALQPGDATPNNGTVTVNADGTYDYTPNTGFVGTDSFTYTICDDDSPTPTCDTATVTITVTDDGAPIAVDDSTSTTEDTPVDGNWISNDDMNDDAVLALQPGDATPSNGTVTVNADGTYTYTPDEGFAGTDTFTYTICDDDTPTAECSTATVTITVEDDGAPIAVDDSASTTEDTPVDGNWISNDDMNDDAVLALQPGDATPSNGTVTVNADGTYTYTPDEGFAGTDTFTYTICDDDTPTAECSTATVTITVEDDGAPIAVDDSASTTEDTPVDGNWISNDDMNDDAVLALQPGDATPSNGTVTVNADGTYTYTPNTGFAGTDTFTYTICDDDTPTAECSTATVTVTVADDGPPIAVDDSASTTEDTPVDGNWISNDDMNDDAVLALQPGDATPSNGTVTVNADGTYTYTPDEGFAGTDTFTYTICDDDTPTAECSTATVTVTVADDGPPIAVDDSASTTEDTPVDGNWISNDDMNDDAVLALQPGDATPSNGTVTVNADGTYTYTPNTGFAGTDTFTYTICDDDTPTAECSTATVTVTVADDGAPLAVNDTNNTDEDTPVNGSAFDNDTLADDATLDSFDATSANGGSVVMNPDGTYTYTPPSGFTGEDTFTYTICDDDTPTPECSTATVTIDVNALPEAVDDTADVEGGDSVVIPVLDNDDQGNGPATVISVSDPDNGSTTINPDGTVEYTPDAGVCCTTDTFTYTIEDQNGDQSTATVTVTIIDTTAPVLAGVPADATVECDAIPAPASPTATDNCDNAPVITFAETSAAGACAQEQTITRTWTATDACGNSSSATQTITVEDNTAPVAPSAPADVTVQCADDVPAPVDLTATDNCDGDITASPTATVTPGACANAFTMVRTWTFTDLCGNTSSVSQTITVLDDTAPVAPSAPADLNLECASDVPAPVDLTATDNCDGDITVSPTATVTPGACANAFTMVRTWTFTDLCGNTSSVSQTITVLDNTAPVAPSVPADLNLECASDVPAPVDLTATDNCDGDITVSANSAIASGGCPNNYTEVRTWTFTDQCGNSSSVSQTITVKDDTAPVAPAAPADLNLECASDVPAPVDLTATDNCDGDITASPTATVTPGACANAFTMVRTWTFTDLCGNTSSVSQTITVLDDTAPVAPSAPADLNLECASDVPAPVDLTATDNCDGDITVSPTATVTPGACANAFTMVRTWTFTDLCGNTSSVSQTITVLDNTAPVAPSAPADLNLECASDVPAPVDLTATDNCDGDITVSPTATVTPGACANAFTMVRTWTFTDLCGNTSSVSQTITVLDNTAPVAPSVPADLNLECASDVPAPVDLTATDNCDGDITASPTATVTPGACANAFTMVRTWTFTDLCGNTSSVSQTITVLDDTAPVAPAAPADVTVQCADDVPAPVDLTATDNCDVDITASPTATVTPGACANDFTMVRTWTFTDLCGNTSSVSQTITVLDDTAPVAPAAPADLNLECASDVPAPVDLTATDNCDGDITVSANSAIASGGCPNNYTEVRTWTFTDQCGNSSSVSQTITVKDDTAPAAPTAPADVTVQCADDVPAPVDLTATDNCDGDITASPTATVTPGACANAFTMVRTWTFTDLCGNTSSVSQTITVQDTTPPSITCPPDVTIECDTNSFPVNTGTATATDNCDTSVDISFSDAIVPGNCPAERTISRTWIATDDCGNTASCIQTINVVDSTPPSLSCPADITVNIDPAEGDGCSALVVLPTPEVVENCGLSSLRMYINGNAAFEHIFVNTGLGGLDQPRPIIFGPDGNLYVSNFGPNINEGSILRYDGTTGAFIDEFVSATTGLLRFPRGLRFGPDGNLYVANYFNNEILKFNAATGALMSTFVPAGGDLLRPTGIIFGPGNDLFVASAGGNNQILRYDGVTGAFEGVFASGLNFPIGLSFGPDDNLYVANINTSEILRYDGNTGVFIDAFVSAAAGGLALPEALEFGPDGNLYVTSFSNGKVLRYDGTTGAFIDEISNKGTVLRSPDGLTFGPDGNLYVSNTGADQIVRYSLSSYNLPLGVNVITFTADDCNSSTSCSYTVTVNDITPPIITCPADVTVECTEDTGPGATGSATATDNCETVTISSSDSSVAGCGNTETITRTWTATDGSGNTASCVQTITVVDTTPPVLNLPPDVTVECDNPTDPSSTGAATGSDTCGAVTISFSDAFAADCGNTGIITRTWTATDACNNTSTSEQIITVVDTTPPSISCPADVFISCADDYLPSGTGFATGSDNCGDVTITYTDDLPEEGRLNCEEIIRTWTATDACGNETSCTQKITTKIELSIIKTFDPTEVPQGTLQSFTIEVSNAGPSDAVDVSVTDLVDASLDVTNVSVTPSEDGDCSASAGQDIDCTVNVPAGGTTTITVDYLTAPFFDDSGSPYNTLLGDDFLFVFVNGDVLEGSTDTGIVLLNGEPADATIITSLTRNDIIFDPPGDDPAFELHLSCSDPFTDGWGQSGGPDEDVDVNWQIAFFTIGRYSPQGFLKSCGNVTNDFDVPNTADASGIDSFGTQEVSDDATVTVGPGITLDKLSTKGKRLTARLTNWTGEDKMIESVEIMWPNSNGNLAKVWLTYGNTSDVIWQGSDESPEALLDDTDPGWNGGTLFTDEAILRFDFKNKVADCPYTIRVMFTDGTWLDISVDCTPAPAANPIVGPTAPLFNISSDENPFDINASLSLESNDESAMVTYSVYDSNNRFLYAATLAPDETFEFGERFRSGLYLVIVQQGDRVGQIRMIKK